MKSMLIIDGSETVAKLFAENFERRGWIVAICGDREGAIQRLGRSERYDAILVDHSMPGTNGVQLVGLIRALEQHRMTAVVMMTASAAVMDEALAAGADEVLIKPINPKALTRTVDKHLT